MGRKRNRKSRRLVLFFASSFPRWQSLPVRLYLKDRMLFFQDLLFIYDGMDIFEVVIMMVEYVPYLLALNAILFFSVRPNLRKYVFFLFPATLGIMILFTILGSYVAAQVKLNSQLVYLNSKLKPS